MKRYLIYLTAVFSFLYVKISASNYTGIIQIESNKIFDNLELEMLKDIGMYLSRDGECEIPDPIQISSHVRNILQAKNGDLWFGSNGFGAIRYNGDSLSYFSVQEGLVGDQITDMMEDKEGNLWFASYGGVSKFHENTITNYTVLDGLSDPWVWNIFQDSNGTIWAGTLAGLCRFDGKQFVDFPIPYEKLSPTRSLLQPERVHAITEDSVGNLWFGTDGLGVYKFDGERFSHFTMQDGLCGNSISSIIEDRQGNFWFGSAFGGISKYDGISFTTFNDTNGIGNNEVCHVYEDKKGYIWFSSEGFGLYRYDGKNLRNYHEEEGLNIPAVQSIYEDKEGRFWVGGGGGLYRFDGDVFVNVTREGPWK